MKWGVGRINKNNLLTTDDRLLTPPIHFFSKPQLDASIFPVELLASLEEILDQNWLPDFRET